MAGMMDMMGAPEPDAGMSDMDADDPGDYEPKDEFEREAMSAFDDSLPMADRMIALREAIKLCGEEDYGSSEKPAGKKPGVDVLLAFGGPKKKG
jgi:hypothetical protein